jgi:hypothetical protein
MNTSKSFTSRVAGLLTGAIGLLLAALGYAALSSGWAHTLLLDLLGIDPAAPPTPDWRENLHRFGSDMLLRGFLLLAAAGIIAFPQHARARLAALLRRPYLLPGGAILALVVVWVPVVLVGYGAVIGGEQHWWLFDDAMISMRYAHNLASGEGLVWNPGERVEGYTNFLWVLYMALVHLFPLSLAKTSLVVALTNIVLAAACLPLLLRIVRLLGGGVLVGAATLLAYVLSQNIAGWTTAGAETPLLSLLFLCGAWRVVREAQQEHSPHPLTYLAIGTLGLVRSDGVVLAVALCGLSFVLNPHKKRVVLYSALAMLLPAAHIAFRLVYYGDIIPNTAHLKVTNWDNKTGHGLAYLLDFAATYIVVVLFALVGALLSRQWSQRLLLGVLLLYGAYVVYAGGDGFMQFRFLVPVLPLLLALAFLGIQRIAPQQAARLALSFFCIATIPLAVPGDTTPLYPRHVAIGNIEIGLLLRHNTPPTTRAADFWAGLVFYHSEVRGIDLLGKNDPHVARLPARYGDVPGHNKFDFDYSLGVLRPDYVLSTFRLPPDEAELRELAQSAAPWRGELYFNQTFREHCLPYPVPLDTLRAIFACDWSPQVDQREEWELPPGLELSPHTR